MLAAAERCVACNGVDVQFRHNVRDHGERVCAVVVLRSGAIVDLAGLRAFAASRLAKFKCPEALLILDGELPKTASAKIAKIELRSTVKASAGQMERLQ